MADNLTTDQAYELKARRGQGGKWWSFAKLKVNKFGNWSVSAKMTPEFRELLASVPNGEYLNLSVFSEYKKPEPKTDTSFNDEIPW